MYLNTTKLVYFLIALSMQIYCHNLTWGQDLVKVGVIVPLTGGLALRGDDVTKLLEIVKVRLNSSNLKHKYDFIIEDGKCGAGNATTTAAMKLISLDHVKFLITGCSGETLQAGPIAERNKVILIAVLSLHPDIKNLGDYIFRTFMEIDRSVQGFAEYMEIQSEGKIAILTEENAFTFGIRDQLIKNLGKKVVFADDFAADSADFNTLLTKANASGAKGIYLNVMSEGTLATLVNQARRLKLQQRLFSYSMPEVSSFRIRTGHNSDGLEFIGTPEVKDPSAEFNEVLAQYLDKHHEGPSYEFILRTTFDAVKSIVDAVEAAGAETSRVKDFLYNYSGNGALGEIKYDQNGDIENLHYVLRKMKPDGTHEVIGQLVKDIDP